jgi:hypothetical protein
MFFPEQEKMCRKLENSKMFDKMLIDSHNGNLIDMHDWILSDNCKDQFDENDYFQWVKDFMFWATNRVFYIMGD